MSNNEYNYCDGECSVTACDCGFGGINYSNAIPLCAIRESENEKSLNKIKERKKQHRQELDKLQRKRW